jgi:hypothetical protein
MEPKKITTDWESIEKEFRLGQKSVRMIADIHGISHTAINKKAKKYGWVQNKAADVKALTEAGLIGFQEGVSKKVSTPTPEEIEIAAQTNIQVITSHRKSIKNSLNLVSILSAQLKEAAENRDEIEEQAIENAKKFDGETDYRRLARFERAISLPSHAATLRDLSTAQKNLIALERQAYSLDKDPDVQEAPDDDLTDEERVILRRAAKALGRKVIGK